MIHANQFLCLSAILLLYSAPRLFFSGGLTEQVIIPTTNIFFNFFALGNQGIRGELNENYRTDNLTKIAPHLQRAIQGRSKLPICI